MLSSDLWRHSLAIAGQCRDHPFVQGIASGELDRKAFQHYLAQDAFFLDAFGRAYGLCAARTADLETKHAFEELRRAADYELELHGSYAERWGAELAVEPVAATRRYIDFLLTVATLEPVGHAAAAMAPCMRLYAWLGQRLAPVTRETSPYKEWVDTYASAEFEAHATKLEGLLDALSVETESAAAHYSRAMELELAFFDSAYRSTKS